MFRNTSHRHAFTLLELMVTLAIVALLVGILLPSVTIARSRGRAAQCASGLRSVGQTIAAFAEAHDDRPAPTVWQRDTHWDRAPQIGWDLETGVWARLLGGSGTMWQCPQQRTAYVGNSQALGVDRRELGDLRYTVMRGQWAEPAKLVLAYDLQYDLLAGLYRHAADSSAADLSDEHYRWRLEPRPFVRFYMPYSGPHQERYGVLFADGHSDFGLFTDNQAVMWSGNRWWPDGFIAPRPGPGETE